MDLIESSLCRLHHFRHFVVPSVTVWDVPALKAQIELRERALKDIKIIRCRLRPFISHGNYCRSRRRRERRSRIGYALQRYD